MAILAILAAGTGLVTSLSMSDKALASIGQGGCGTGGCGGDLEGCPGSTASGTSGRTGGCGVGGGVGVGGGGLGRGFGDGDNHCGGGQGESGGGASGGGGSC